MNLTVRVLTGLLLLLAGGGAIANEFRAVTAAEIEQMFQAARDRPGARLKDEEGMQVIDHPAERTTWVFLTAGHAAYPAVMVKQIREAGGTLYIETRGYAAGDPCAFDAWLRGYDVADTGLCPSAGK
jgi:hypothetical protein